MTASLTLAGKGFRVVLLEKAERLEETGAGLQLSPNASRILIELGLAPRLAARAVTPDSISLMSARSGREVTRLPLGDAATARAGAPYWVVHRADLQAALQAEVSEHPDIELRLGCQFEDAVTHAKGLTIVQRSGTTRQQDLALALIGADGIWSTVRQHLFPELQPQFSGLIAWRGTLDSRQLPREYTSGRVQLWMGPNAHLVAYPISGARQINIVAVVPGTWNRPGWSAPGEIGEIKNAFGSSRWAMAIEDAAVLAKCLGEAAGDNAAMGVPAALKRYAKLRRPRVNRVQRAAERAGMIYHLTGPMALARDLAIKTMGANRVLAQQRWIYDWRA